MVFMHINEKLLTQAKQMFPELSDFPDKHIVEFLLKQHLNEKTREGKQQ